MRKDRLHDMDPRTRANYLDFVDRSFRDMADQDYLAARMLYRYGLGHQFLFSAHQALEKYLKAILLYNDKATSDLSHDLERAYKRLFQIKEIPCEFPNDVAEFVGYLNTQGNNRYLERYAYTTGDELLLLDRTVWYIRRYCWYMGGYSTPGADGQRIYLFPGNLKYVRLFRVKDAKNFRIPGGYLECLLQKRKSPLRDQLVWKNFYYGTYRKKRITRFRRHSWSVNPAHYLDPDVFDILEKRVRFSSGFKKWFQGVRNSG